MKLEWMQARKLLPLDQKSTGESPSTVIGVRDQPHMDTRRSTRMSKKRKPYEESEAESLGVDTEDSNEELADLDEFVSFQAQPRTKREPASAAVPNTRHAKRRRSSSIVSGIKSTQP